MRYSWKPKPCNDCGVKPGELHAQGCDVERCPDCGGQYITCDCVRQSPKWPRIPWSGQWPGVKECREYNLYSKMVPNKGWIPCDKDDPGASEDLNRLHIDYVWDPRQAKFVSPK